MACIAFVHYQWKFSFQRHKLGSDAKQVLRCRLSRRPLKPSIKLLFDGGVSLDPLSTFTELVWRSQEQICKDTAACDGLGTYHDVDSLPFVIRDDEENFFPRQQRRTMHGGRAFDEAFADVWLSRAGNGSARRRTAATRSRILTSLHKDSGEIKRIVDGAGLAVRLKPRSLISPTLRATAYFFQAGDFDAGTWWFNGSIDLCRPLGMSLNEFFGDARQFLLAFDQICSTHRRSQKLAAVESRASFLESCWNKGETDSNCTGNSGLDQIAGFGFVGACLEALIPAYLSLLASKRQRDRFYGSDWTLSQAMQLNAEDEDDYEDVEELMCREANSNAVEHAERIALDGGAILESKMIEGPPFALWRFNVIPSALSPAGRMYDALRRDTHAIPRPCVYL